ncbi:MAG: aldehyde dehydrogenase family protein [Anaerocolumna sp.]
MKALPVLRFGEAYESSRKNEIYDYENNVMDEISMAIPLIFKSDIKKKCKDVSCKLRDTGINQLVEWIKKAGEIFTTAELDIEGRIESPEAYCDSIMRVTGLPRHMCKDILQDFRGYMEHIDEIIIKQFRLNDLTVLDTFITTHNGMEYAIVPKTEILCAVMPGNHPIVNMMWIIAFAMKYPVVIKPSFDDPYTPLRLIYSLIQAGADREFFSFYPVEHSEVTELVKAAGYGIVFGGNDVKELYKNLPWIRVYGPGNSKMIVGRDSDVSIEKIAELAAVSALFHSGRACISTSAVITENHGEELAAAIGKIFSKIELKDLNGDTAIVGAVKDKQKAGLMAEAVHKFLQSGNFVDMTPEVEIVQYLDNKAFLMPKVLYCKDIRDPGFGIEYSFPFIIVGEKRETEWKDILKSTLSCLVISDNPKLVRELLLLPGVEKIYHGFVDSWRMDFGMPHNGFMSEFLYKYKAFKCSSEGEIPWSS